MQISSGATGAGGATRVIMRGMKSLTKNNNALYVIDGVPMFNTGSSGGDGQYGSMGGSDAVADLNPDDIESISHDDRTVSCCPLWLCRSQWSSPG